MWITISLHSVIFLKFLNIFFSYGSLQVSLSCYKRKKQKPKLEIPSSWCVWGHWLRPSEDEDFGCLSAFVFSATGRCPFHTRPWSPTPPCPSQVPILSLLSPHPLTSCVLCPFGSNFASKIGFCFESLAAVFLASFYLLACWGLNSGLARPRQLLSYWGVPYPYGVCIFVCLFGDKALLFSVYSFASGPILKLKL